MTSSEYIEAEIHYDDAIFQEFNDSLDTEGEITIANFSAKPSYVLFQMDKVAYKEAYESFETDKIEETKEIIYEYYPSIIGHHLRLSEKGFGANDPVKKLLHLKDTWESIIHVLHAIVWGEVRRKNINLNSAQVFVSSDTTGNSLYKNFNTAKLLSDSIKQKLYNIKAIITYSKKNNLNLKCEEITEVLTDDLLALQDVRNDLSHHATMTAQEAKVELSRIDPIFRKMLPKTRFLENCKIFRFESYSTNCHCEKFNGFSLKSEFELFTIEKSNLDYVLSLRKEQLFLIWDTDCFSLSPFLHFTNDISGHESFLCCYNKKAEWQVLF